MPLRAFFDSDLAALLTVIFIVGLSLNALTGFF